MAFVKSNILTQLKMCKLLRLQAMYLTSWRLFIHSLLPCKNSKTWNLNTCIKTEYICIRHLKKGRWAYTWLYCTYLSHSLLKTSFLGVNKNFTPFTLTGSSFYPLLNICSNQLLLPSWYILIICFLIYIFSSICPDTM